MPRRPATITQADVARTIRAAKQAGAGAVRGSPRWNNRRSADCTAAACAGTGRHGRGYHSLKGSPCPALARPTCFVKRRDTVEPFGMSALATVRAFVSQHPTAAGGI